MQKVFEKIIERFKSEVNYNDGAEIGLKQSVEIVKQEAEQYNNGWIPRSERLPAFTGHYLVTKEDCNVIMFAWWKSSERRWFYYNSTKEMMDVIAWQPLPEPYPPKGE